MREMTLEERHVNNVMAREDFYFFSRYMFLRRKGYQWMRAPHHPIICNALTRVFNGQCKRLIINIPPRYSKTELAVVNWVPWCLGKVPDAEFIHASYSSMLAVNNSGNMRSLMQHEAYKEVFGGTVLDSEARHHWTTTKGGVMYAAGAGGTITGFGAGKHRNGFGGAIIIDDPHKPDEVTSEVMRTNVIDWFQNTLESRKNDPANTPIIVIMQRLHEKDLSGWLLDGGNGEEWEHIRLPALNEEDGTALWPEKHSVEKLKVMQSKNSYVFAGQYQQRPAPLGGGIIKGAWFKRYSVLPPLQWRAIYGDTAQKTGERNDYSVFQCWGKGEDGRIYLIDQIRGKWEAPDLKRNCIDFWNKHVALDHSTKPVGALRSLNIEDKASGTGLIQDIRIDGKIPVNPIERVKDKLTRVMDISSYIESGYIYLPEEKAFVSDFVRECELFTPDDTHEHDDQIDPMCDAINQMLADYNDRSDIWAKMAEA